MNKTWFCEYCGKTYQACYKWKHESTHKHYRNTKIKCHKCRIRLSLVEEQIGLCKCGFVFCFDCRYPEEHDCEFDHKEDQRKKLEKGNPKVVFEKIIKI